MKLRETRRTLIAPGKIKLTAGRNTRLKRRDASWFPRVPCSLLDARYRWNERAEIQRWGLDPAEKRWGIYLKWHRLDPRRPPKDLFPRRAALSGEKRGAVSLLFLSLFPFTCFSFSLRPTWREFLVRASQEALVPRHFRWWPPTATAKHRAPRTNGSLIDPEMNREMVFILIRRLFGTFGFSFPLFFFLFKRFLTSRQSSIKKVNYYPTSSYVKSVNNKWFAVITIFHWITGYKLADQIWRLIWTILRLFNITVCYKFRF